MFKQFFDLTCHLRNKKYGIRNEDSWRKNVIKKERQEVR